jgi:Sulfocyanin (SoxE) domain
MHNQTPRRHPGLLLAGTVLVIGSACSKGADQRAAAADSGTSSAAVSADTSGSSASTTSGASSGATTSTPSDNAGSASAMGSDNTSQTHASSASVAAPAKPRVRPNIDPGRVSTKPKTSSAAATPPASTATPSDTASAASASSGSDSTETQAASSGQQGEDLKYDAASNTVTFQLIGGPHGFQFNGFSSGGATLTLPPKANVVINFVNKDGTPHSAEVIPGEGPIPNAGGDPALPRAFTNQLLQGLPQEGTDNMKFTVPASGSYRIFCGVPGHGLSGMWMWMKVDPAAKAPSFGATKS